MLTDKSMNQTANKLDRFVNTLMDRLFVPAGRAGAKGPRVSARSLSSAQYALDIPSLRK